MAKKKRKRRTFTAKQKVAILKEHLLEGKAVSDVCEKHEISPTNFYTWLKVFFENADAAFEKKKPSKDKKRIAELEEKIQDKNEIISELVEDNVKLKKNLGES